MPVWGPAGKGAQAGGLPGPLPGILLPDLSLAWRAQLSLLGPAPHQATVTQAGRLRLRHIYSRGARKSEAHVPTLQCPPCEISRTVGAAAEPSLLQARGVPCPLRTEGDSRGQTTGPDCTHPFWQETKIGEGSPSLIHTHPATPSFVPFFLPWQGLRGHRALVLEEALECADLQHGHQQQHRHVDS